MPYASLPVATQKPDVNTTPRRPSSLLVWVRRLNLTLLNGFGTKRDVPINATNPINATRMRGSIAQLL